MKFEEGPDLPFQVQKQSCGRIIDRESGHVLVIIAGGEIEIITGKAITTTQTDATLIWDTVTNIIVQVIHCQIYCIEDIFSSMSHFRDHPCLKDLTMVKWFRYQMMKSFTLVEIQVMLEALIQREFTHSLLEMDGLR